MIITYLHTLLYTARDKMQQQAALLHLQAVANHTAASNVRNQAKTTTPITSTDLIRATQAGKKHSATVTACLLLHAYRPS